MSASNRSLHRLPPSLFGENPHICRQLQARRIKTVGRLLQLSPVTLLKVMDPLLTYG